MTYSVHITTAAERDVANATDYIDQVLKNPKAADELLEAFLQQVNDLAVFPARYPLVALLLMLAACGVQKEELNDCCMAAPVSQSTIA